MLRAAVASLTILAAAPGARAEIRLMTLDPGHFHAALIQAEMYPGVSPKVDVYAPLGPDLVAHLQRIARFNARAADPTAWRLEVHAAPDFLERMKREKPGNVVVVAGRNRGKIDYIQASVNAGFHALVDKPWILKSDDLGKLKATLDAADKKGRIALDIMTERFEITTVLQKELVEDADVFGQIAPGTPQSPSVNIESVHHLMKTVAGAPNIRPAWFFDTEQQGEGLSDIGTHFVDLVPWMLFPGQAIDPAKEITLVAAQRWPTVIPLPDFQRVTGDKEWPAFLTKDVKSGALEYFCNTRVTYAIRGVHARIQMMWNWEAPPGGGDTHFSSFRGTRARVEVRQGRAEKMRQELYVTPEPGKKAEVLAALRRRVGALAQGYPGMAVEEHGADLRVTIPDKLRSAEEHFPDVARRFFDLTKNPKSLPTWEKPNMIAKYWVTTKGTELARQSPPARAGRLGPE